MIEGGSRDFQGGISFNSMVIISQVVLNIIGIIRNCIRGVQCFIFQGGLFIMVIVRIGVGIMVI